MDREESGLTLLTTIGVRAVKTFRRVEGGGIEEEGYGRARKFTAKAIELDEQGRWLERLAKKSNSFVVMGRTVDWKEGEVKRRLSSERDGDSPTIEDCPRLWMPIDVDKPGFDPVGTIDDGETFALQTLNWLGLKGTYCVWHLTNSHGFGDRWRVRLWVLLRKAATCSQMKEYAKAAWGDKVDMSVYKPAQPIYTGDPVLVGVESPVATRVGWLDGGNLRLRGVKAKAAPGGKPADENVEMLMEAGLYIGELRPGQHRIRCPWEEEHTEAGHRDDDTFYFEPHYNGHDIPAFKCHHAHCADRRWENVLDELGVKRTNFSPVSEDDDTPAWVYVHRLRQFWDSRDGALVEREVYDSINGGTRARGESPTQRFMASNRTTKVDVAEFLPGDSRVVRRGQIKVLNMYIDQRVQPDPDGESGPFREHLRWLVPDEAERETLTRWIAWAYVNPGQKITWAPILYGAPGTGKTTVMNVLADLLGRDYMSEPSQSELEDKFTDWVFRKLLVKIEELRSEDKFHVAEKLKPVVANPTISVRRMHETGFSVRNVANVIASTNHMEALPIERGDRRYMLIQCCEASKRERRDHMRALHQWLKEAGLGGIAHWLTTVDLSGFRPESEAPETHLKQVVMEASKNEFERAVDLMEDFAREQLITSTVMAEVLMENECKVPNKRLGLLAHRLGWLAAAGQQRRVRHNHRKITLWSPSKDRSQLRRVVEMEFAERNQFLTRLDERLLSGKGQGKWQKPSEG